MDANQDILQGTWPEIKARVKQQWGKLTDDDLTRLSGKTAELVDVLRQRYGYGQAQAEIEIDSWLRARIPYTAIRPVVVKPTAGK
ncbi:MAG: CsbD family protein [Chloroflexi bacterium]|nr:CsbD family protein [Chloroflexota bacterium]